MFFCPHGRYLFLIFQKSRLIYSHCASPVNVSLFRNVWMFVWRSFCSLCSDFSSFWLSGCNFAPEEDYLWGGGCVSRSVRFELTWRLTDFSLRLALDELTSGDALGHMTATWLYPFIHSLGVEPVFLLLLAPHTQTLSSPETLKY